MLQPHKGSSETGTSPRTWWTSTRLQPHKGSSETRPGATRRLSVPCFNPTKVRLKPGSECSVSDKRVLLQPHEGSSETSGVFASASTCCQLQPHEGSSETEVWGMEAETGISFNPTKVRLKLGATTNPLPVPDSLQPHEGSSETFSIGKRSFEIFRASTPRRFV